MEDEEVESGFKAKLAHKIASVPCLKDTMFYGVTENWEGEEPGRKLRLASSVGSLIVAHGWSGRWKTSLATSYGVFVLVSLALFVPCNNRARQVKRQFTELEEALAARGEAMENLRADAARRAAAADASSKAHPRKEEP